MGSEAVKSGIQEMEEFPSSAYASALKSSESLSGKSMEVRGYDFNKGLNYEELFQSMATTGFQASLLAQAIDLVNTMLDWDLTHEPVGEEEESGEAFRRSVKCKIFLGFTSNLISSGVRDTIRFLVQHHMVHVVVTTAGGVEEDLIKCLAPTYTGDFSLPGAQLRSKGLNRIGNLLVPNDNYCKFEDWIIPIFDQLLKEQKEQGVIWTPSKVIARLGKEINNPNSYCYWAYKFSKEGITSSGTLEGAHTLAITKEGPPDIKGFWEGVTFFMGEEDFVTLRLEAKGELKKLKTHYLMKLLRDILITVKIN
ncbi:deoxyhypusine synthase isoform X2 [Cryptomeria japonica]|uniref:deoxyhypusine synthase isoform X2 n=1 Tax=Cryptomeria japonica TaxID=3369 RepID=UPI0027DA27C9|nr:deoxyhypusine synthase isoform X2 [Cryptomeria japonica]